MSIIEKASKRLLELERAGVEVHWGAAGVSRDESANLIKAAARAAQAVAPTARAGGPVIPETARVHAPSTRQVRASTSRLSREVELDMERLLSEGYLVPGTSRSDAADEFRVIKRPLLANTKSASARGVPRANLIMVTSALAGEGKTFCALNLALSLASEVDSSVLLVDADVLRPAALDRLGVAGEHMGLLDLLVNSEMDVAEVLLKTNIPKLTVMPAGAPRIDSTELLASETMNELLGELSAKYPERIIIFDAPPLLVTTEAKVLASRMGQVLVVVDESRAHQNEIVKAFALLKDNPVVMSVLNKSRRRNENARYGYYSGADRQGRVPARA
jgi:protein-tyrosine kinase